MSAKKQMPPSFSGTEKEWWYFMQQGTTVTSEVYCEILKIQHKPIQIKRHWKLTSSIVFLHDNGCPHIFIQALLEHFNFELSDHPPYTVDPALSIILFTYLKNWLGLLGYSASPIVRCWWKMWKMAELTGIQKLISQYDKCFNFDSNYVEQ
jgi:hypothetical protein